MRREGNRGGRERWRGEKREEMAVVVLVVMMMVGKPEVLERPYGHQIFAK